MRRITLWLLSTIAAIVLLFSYRTSTMGAGTTSMSNAGLGNDSSGAGSSGGTASGGGTIYKGPTAQTRWGPIQVTITVVGNQIADVAVPTYPNGNGRDRQINAYALPILTQETLAAQSADIDSVSGATVTSEGYKRSLQAAISAAHLS